MKIIVYLFLLVSPSLFCQYNYDDCPLDSTTNLVLICVIPEYDSLYDFYESYHVYVQNVDDENCELFRYDWKTNCMFGSDGEKSKISTNQITHLNITFRSSGNSFYFVRPLDKFEVLNSIELPALKHFSIESVGVNYTMNLKKWKMYDLLLKNQTIQTLSFERNAINDDWFVPFEAFKSMREITISDYRFYLNFSLDQFPELKKFNRMNTYFFFAHYLVDFPNLVEMPSYYEQGYNYNDLYPEMTFFCNETSPLVIGHPFYEINKIIDRKLQDHQDYSGNMVITRSEVNDDLINKKNEKDTVAIGAVLNGQPIGKWNFRLPHFQVFSPQWYYYNYDKHVSLDYPKNGEWKYYYDNGTLAISGQFKKGKKNGKWQFYNTDGTLSSVKSFEFDKPRGLFINYRNFNEVNRLYVLSDIFTLHGSEIDGSYYISQVYNQYINKFSLDEYGQLKKMNNGEYVKEIRKNSWRYNKLLKKYLRFLFPDKKVELRNLSFVKRTF